MRAKTLDAAVATLSLADTTALRDSLEKWCAARWPGATLDRVRGKAASGASSELLFLELRGREGRGSETLVLRLASRWPVYPLEDLERQGRSLHVVARGLPSSLQVPRIKAVETRSLPGLERPFLVMSCVEGRPAPDQPSYVREGWLSELGDRERESLWLGGIEAMAAVHACPLTAGEATALRLPVPGDGPLQRLLNYWSLFLNHVEQHGQYPVLRSTVSWLHQHAPDRVNAPCMVWGDASLRNMLFEGLSPRVLLDFEFAHVGLRELDVAFYPLMDFVMAEGFADGTPRLGGFSGLSDSMDHYQSLSGQPIHHRDYFLRMALSYMALSTTRVYQRLALRRDIPPEAVAHNPPLRLLEEVMTGRRQLPA